MRRFGLLGLVSVVSLLSAAQAGAMVTVSPTGSFTATSTGTVSFIITSGIGSTTVMQCTTVTFTGTFANNVTAGAPTVTVPQFIAGVTAPAAPVDRTQGNVLMTCIGGRIAGQIVTMTCDGRSNIGATGVTAAGVTPGRLTALNCRFLVPSCGGGSSTAGLTGAVSVTYDNATGRLTVLAAGQNLTVVSTCPPIPSGRMVMSSSAAGPVDVLFNVTPTGRTIVAT